MKKALKIVLITVLCLGLVGGGVFAIVRYSGKQSVTAYLAGSYLLNYMPDQSYIYGNVTSDVSQTIYKDEDKKILEILVQPGQKVSVGDPLLRYDATMDSINLEEKLLEREKLAHDLESSYVEYARYARTPYPRTLPTPTPTPSSSPRTAEASHSGNGFVHMSQKDSGLSVVQLGSRRSVLVQRDLSAPVSGEGTGGNPYVYSISDGETVTAAFLEGVKTQADAEHENRTIYCRLDAPGSVSVSLEVNPEGTMTFAVTAPEVAPFTPNFNKPAGGKGSSSKPYVYTYASGVAVPIGFIEELRARAMDPENPQDIYVTLSASGFSVPMVFRNDGTLSFRVTAALPTPSPSPTPTPTLEPTATPDPSLEPDPSGEPTPFVPGGGMSRAEREALARSIAKDIRENEVKYRQLSLDIQKLQMEGATGLLLSTVNGTVSTVNDYEQVNNGDVILSVQGGSGLYVASLIGEMDLSKYSVGTELTGYAYDSSQEVTVRISNVGKMPLTTSYRNGNNPNNSAYLAAMEILGNVELNVGEYIEFSSYKPITDMGVIYLSAAFIKTIDGEDCIFVVRDGVLVKEKVKTGKRVYEYVELIDSSLTPEDYIAFPYEKNAREGAPAEMPEDGDNLVIY